MSCFRFFFLICISVFCFLLTVLPTRLILEATILTEVVIVLFFLNIGHWDLY